MAKRKKSKKRTAKKAASKKKTKKKPTRKKAAKKKTSARKARKKSSSSTKKKKSKKSTKKSGSTKKKKSSRKSKPKSKSKSKSKKKKSSRKSKASKKSSKAKSTKKNSSKSKAGSKTSKRPARKKSKHETPSDDTPRVVVHEDDKATIQLITGQAVRKEFVSRSAELTAQQKKAKRVLAKLKNEFLKDETFIEEDGFCLADYGPVSGVCVGLRSLYDRLVTPLEFVIEVHVAYPIPELPHDGWPFKKIPDSRGGVPIVVIVSPPPEPPEMMMMKARSYYEGSREAPPKEDIAKPEEEIPADGIIRGGLPISESEKPNEWGTFGIRVPLNDGTHIGLCNAHFAAKDAFMIQPAVYSPISTNQIGTVTKSKFKVYDNGEYDLDAAMIQLRVDKTFGDGVLGFENSRKFYFAGRRLGWQDFDTVIEKRGAFNKRVLRGKLKNPEFDDVVIQGRLYKNIIQVKSEYAYQDGGDSGSVGVVRIDDNGEIAYLVVALFFGNTDNRNGYACHFSDVMKAFTLDVPKDMLKEDWTTVELGQLV